MKPHSEDRCNARRPGSAARCYCRIGHTGQHGTYVAYGPSPDDTYWIQWEGEAQ